MKDRILTVFTIVLFAGGLGSLGWVFFKSYLKSHELATIGETACVNQQLSLTMADDLMRGSLNQGDPYEVLLNYYKCNPVGRNELAYLKINPMLEPVVKRVHGLPGDRFEVMASDAANTYHLKINDQLVKATNGETYFFMAEEQPPLKTFEIARQGVLGANEFIVLSDVSPGGGDSTTLGIVKMTAIEGKVVPSN